MTGTLGGYVFNIFLNPGRGRIYHLSDNAAWKGALNQTGKRGGKTFQQSMKALFARDQLVTFLCWSSGDTKVSQHLRFFYSHETMLKSFQYNKFGGRFLRWEIIKRSLIIWIASAVPGSQPRCQTKKLTLLPQSKYHLEVMITAVLPFQNYHLWTMWCTFSAVSDDGSWMIFSSIPRHGSQVIAVRFVGLLRHQSD